MPRTATAAPFELPTTIAGLWGLCALAPLRSRRAYDDAATLCGKLAIRRLSTIQREYFRELRALVETYEEEHGEEGSSLRALQRLALER